MKTKVIPYLDREIELTSVFFHHYSDAGNLTLQEGILVHDSADEFHDGDAIYDWKLEHVQYASDLDSLFENPSDGSTYFHRNHDGTYTIDA